MVVTGTLRGKIYGVFGLKLGGWYSSASWCTVQEFEGDDQADSGDTFSVYVCRRLLGGSRVLSSRALRTQALGEKHGYPKHDPTNDYP